MTQTTPTKMTVQEAYQVGPRITASMIEQGLVSIKPPKVGGAPLRVYASKDARREARRAYWRERRRKERALAKAEKLRKQGEQL